VAAGFIDLIPLVLIAAALSERQPGTRGAMFTVEGLRFVVLALVSLAYYFVSEATASTTFGKRLVGLTITTSDGGPIGVGAALKRTLLRVIDGLPVLYLVGFVCALATPNKQRIGDMVAATHVVRRQNIVAAGTGAAPARRGASAIVGAIAAVTLGAGVVGLVVKAGQPDPNDTVGVLNYDDDVVPQIDQLMTILFKDQSTPALMEVFVDGAATAEQSDAAFEQLNQSAGEWSGTYTIIDHRSVEDVTFTDLDGQTLDITEVKATTSFEAGPAVVLLAFTDVDGELRLLSWNVRPGEPEA
jgi:uncharacterized RDD family membrane protein YckC